MPQPTATDPIRPKSTSTADVPSKSRASLMLYLRRQLATAFRASSSILFLSEHVDVLKRCRPGASKSQPRWIVERFRPVTTNGQRSLFARAAMALTARCRLRGFPSPSSTMHSVWRLLSDHRLLRLATDFCRRSFSLGCCGRHTPGWRDERVGPSRNARTFLPTAYAVQRDDGQ